MRELKYCRRVCRRHPAYERHHRRYCGGDGNRYPAARLLREVAKAAIAAIEQPKTTLDPVAGYRRGPELPDRSGDRTPRAEIRKFTKTGGARCVCARYGPKRRRRGRYRAAASGLGAKCWADCCRCVIKLPMVDDLRDESGSRKPDAFSDCATLNRVDMERSDEPSDTDLEKLPY